MRDLEIKGPALQELIEDLVREQRINHAQYSDLYQKIKNKKRTLEDSDLLFIVAKIYEALKISNFTDNFLCLIDNVEESITIRVFDEV